MPRALLNLDVDDIERAVAFYTAALELRVGRRFDSGFVELLGAEAPIYLLQKAAGSAPFEGADQLRGYTRHWMRSTSTSSSPISTPPLPERSPPVPFSRPR